MHAYIIEELCSIRSMHWCLLSKYSYRVTKNGFSGKSLTVVLIEYHGAKYYPYSLPISPSTRVFS